MALSPLEKTPPYRGFGVSILGNPDPKVDRPHWRVIKGGKLETLETPRPLLSEPLPEILQAAYERAEGEVQTIFSQPNRWPVDVDWQTTPEPPIFYKVSFGEKEEGLLMKDAVDLMMDTNWGNEDKRWDRERKTGELYWHGGKEMIVRVSTAGNQTLLVFRLATTQGATMKRIRAVFDAIAPKYSELKARSERQKPKYDFKLSDFAREQLERDRKEALLYHNIR